MAFNFLTTFTPRRFIFDYVSPAVCEAIFTGTSTASVSLLPINRDFGPRGLLYEWFGEFALLRWDIYPGALCYSIYKAVDEIDPFGDYFIVAECVTDNFLSNLAPGTYRVTAITENGETDFSDPITIAGAAGSSTCAQFGDALPDDWYVDDGTEVFVMESGQTYGPENLIGGEYQIQYVDGTVTGDFIPNPAWHIEIIPTVNLYIGPDFSSATTNYICSDPLSPPDCDPEENLVAAHADKVLKTLDINYSGLDDVSLVVLSADSFSYTNISGVSNFKFVRTKKFRTFPASVTIANLSEVAGVLQCSNDGSGAQWNGVLSENFFASKFIAQWTYFGGAFIGTSQVAQATLRGDAGNAWTLTIQGDGEILWIGVKSLGDTPSGNYARTYSCNENAPSCLTVV